MSKRKLSPGEHFVAGTIAGLSSTVALFPLDTIKVRFQVNEKTTLAAPQRLKSAFEKVIKEEGWRGLYQGLQAGMLGSGLSWGGYFYFYEHAKQRWVTSDGGKQPGALAWMAASAEAGTIMVALTNPIWLVKTRLQLQLRQIAKQSTTASTAAPTTAPLVDPSLSGTVRRQPYKGFFDAISTIVREEGILALYKGSIPALMLVSHGAAQFVVYEAMKSEYAKRYDQKTPGTFTVLSMGAAAKIFASIATYPFQVGPKRSEQILVVLDNISAT
jgi:solute carrier family 25 folate transporter 32